MNNDWYKLDNVAKLFSATSSPSDPKVFRVSCTLTEPVQPELLQQALVITAKRLPSFQVKLHHGLFWYYLEDVSTVPKAEEENLPVCSPIYDNRLRGKLLYRVSYYKTRINVEVYHVLADGTGGMVFLRTLVGTYCKLAHPEALEQYAVDCDGSIFEKSSDSFEHYYTPRQAKVAQTPKVYRPGGNHLPNHQIQVFEGHTSVEKTLAIAREYHTTITGLLMAVLAQAVYDQMSTRERRKPISFRVPINLRNYFPSQTTRNFFGLAVITYHFTGEETLEELADSLTRILKEELQLERIEARMAGFSAIEHLFAIKTIPLWLKNVVLRAVNHFSENQSTMTISNVGRITVSPEVAPYIAGFSSVCTSPGLFLCTDSYQDDLVVSFTSVLENTDIPKNFYRRLSALGLDLTLYAN